MIFYSNHYFIDCDLSSFLKINIYHILNSELVTKQQSVTAIILHM